MVATVVCAGAFQVGLTESEPPPVDGRVFRIFIVMGICPPGGSIPGEFANFCYIPIVAPPVVHRRLAYERAPPDGRAAEDMPKSIFTDRPKPYMLVPVKSAPELALAVVEVYDPEVGETDPIVEIPEHRIDPLSGSEVVAGGKSVAGVKTYADPSLRTDTLEYPADILYR